MKKISLLLALAMVLAIAFSGCAKPDSSESTPATASESAAVSAVQSGGAETTQATETKTVKAGFIYIGPANDGGFSTSHDKGRLYLEQQLGIETIYKELVPESAEAEATIDNLIEEGCNMIFACSYGYIDYMENKAAEYPDVYFLHCSGWKSNGVNFVNYFGRIYQARFLTGLVAGMTTQTNKIGYVAAYSIPEVNRGINAFALGVAAVNPEATIEVFWTSDWVDAAKAKEGANALIAKGCDVIAQHQDATSPQQAAEEAGIHSIGYHCDMISSAPNANVASAVWNWGPYYVAVVQSVMDGTWTGENYWGGMDEGVVDIVLTANAPEGAQAIVDEYKAKTLSGEWDVFTGPITDNQGNVICAEGQVLTDEEMLGIMWLNSNVIGSMQS